MSAPMQAASAERARRAIGAMFFFPFGGAWFALWAYRASARPIVLYVEIAVLTAALLGLAYWRYRVHAPALAAQPETPEQRRASRIFQIVNAAQWVLILVVGNVLANLGLGAWVIPAVIIIVGLHFLPLARVFANPPHYVTGLALVAIGAGYPLLTPAGPASPIGCLLTGVVLWLSAARALAAKSA